MKAIDDDALDDLVCDLQDAYFEARYDECIELCNRVIGVKKKEEGAHEMLLACHLNLGHYNEVIKCGEHWVTTCGESLKQLNFTTEAAYMLEDQNVLKDCVFK